MEAANIYNTQTQSSINLIGVTLNANEVQNAWLFLLPDCVSSMFDFSNI